MTTATKPAWIAALHPDSPYEGLEPTPRDLQGWGSDSPIFERLIQEIRPELIVEVGSWKGASAVGMAKCMAKHGVEGHVLCVDTWLGSLEQWLEPTERQHGYFNRYMVHGAPLGLYAQFLANVVHEKLQEVVLPFPTTSTIAAKWLAAKGVKVDLVYLDGSHEYEDVLSDLRLYWPLLSEKGVLFGDDYESKDVKRAVGEFSLQGEAMMGVEVEGNKWALRRA